MTVTRLKSEFWVRSQVRLCDLRAIPVSIPYRGDPDAGAILVKIVRPGEGVRVFSQMRDATGAPAWLAATGDGPVAEAAADAYIARQRAFDPDLWLIEIEDRDGLYSLDGEIL